MSGRDDGTAPDHPEAGEGVGPEGGETAASAGAALRIALETAGPVGSVALAAGGRVLGRVFLDEQNQHQRLLVPALDRLMREAGLEREALEGVVVGAGPGSFTGVRIAAAAGKAIAHVLRLPMWAVSSLAGAAVAEWVLEPDPERWPALPGVEPLDEAPGEALPRYVLFDARGDRVYAACYRLAAEGLRTLVGPRGTCLGEILDEDVPEGSVFAGDAALRHRDRLRAAGYRVLAAPAGVPSAAGLLHVLATAEDPEPLEDPARWQPDYLRASSAERERVG